MPATKVRRKHRKKTQTAPRPAPVFAQLPQEVKPKEAQTEAPDHFGLPWKTRIAPAILLVLVTLAIYIQVIHHPFTNYDDAEYVQTNRQIQGGVTLKMLRWALTSTDHSNWHPVTWISHALDWQLFGPSPAGPHFMSLLLHVATVVLLFLFLADVTGSTIRSFLVALLFSIHPVSVESVAWIAERKTVLCTLFFLAALLAYTAYARRPGLLRYLALALLFGLSLASKAMTVTLPVVLLLLDFWPLRRIEGWTKPSLRLPAPQFRFYKLVLEKLPLMAMTVADCLVTMKAQTPAIRSTARFPLSLRFENAIVSYASYLWNTVWPTRLSVLYPYPSAGLPAWKIIVSSAVLVTGSILAWRWRSRGYLITGWCWFLGTLVPVIGVIQVGEQAMADRYAYLPLIGIYILAVWGLSDLAQRASARVRSFVAVAAGAVLVVLAGAAYGQVRLWRTNIDLWSHAVAVTQNNSGAEDVIGSELLVQAMNAGRHYSDEALIHFQNALKIDPHDSRALFSVALDLRGRGHAKEALDEFQLALKYADDNELKSQTLSGIGACYEMLGDYPRARQYYLEALQLSPEPDSDSFVGYSRTFTDEQIVKVSSALMSHPTAEGFWQLGQLQEAAGRPDDAQRSYRQALSSTLTSPPPAPRCRSLHVASESH